MIGWFVNEDLIGNLLTNQYGIVNQWKLLAKDKLHVSYNVCNNGVIPNISKL